MSNVVCAPTSGRRSRTPSGGNVAHFKRNRVQKKIRALSQAVFAQRERKDGARIAKVEKVASAESPGSFCRQQSALSAGNLSPGARR